VPRQVPDAIVLAIALELGFWVGSLLEEAMAICTTYFDR
jgi:hypothetical protein